MSRKLTRGLLIVFSVLFLSFGQFSHAREQGPITAESFKDVVGVRFGDRPLVFVVFYGNKLTAEERKSIEEKGWKAVMDAGIDMTVHFMLNDVNKPLDKTNVKRAYITKYNGEIFSLSDPSPGYKELVIIFDKMMSKDHVSSLSGKLGEGGSVQGHVKLEDFDVNFDVELIEAKN